MVKRRPARRRSRRRPTSEYPTANVDRIRIRLQGWYLRTLRTDTTGEYGKLKRMLELFLMQAERALRAQLWDRGTEVALEEAMQHLALAWGPKFRGALPLEVRIMDTHLKFSLTVPPTSVIASKKSGTAEQRQRREAAAARSLYVVKRLSNRLHIGPAGRQLVFWMLVRRDWGLSSSQERGRVG